MKSARIATIFAVAGLAGVAAAQERVVINEILYDPAGADEGFEKLELKNLSAATVNLTGWQLCVHLQYSGALSFNAVTLDPGEILVVHLRASGMNDANNVFLPSFPSAFGGTTLVDSSDGVALYNCNLGGCFTLLGALNSMIDFVQWGMTGQGVNQERHNIAADTTRPGGALWSPAGDLDFAPQSGDGMSIQYDGTDSGGGELTLGTDFFVDNPTIGAENPVPDCQGPADCDDGVGCTDDDCVSGTCVYTPNNANCIDDGLFCTGDEICDGTLDCISTGDPCPAGRICDDDVDQCKLPSIDIALELVAGGTAAAELGADPLVSPVYLTHAGDGSGRLFIVDQIGTIRIVENGVLLATPFLDVTAKLPALDPGFDERGLLGLAFHPNYAVNGRFFIRYSAPRAAPLEPCDATSRGCHKAILAEYAVSGGDPNVADAGSEAILISVDEPEFNHDAGQVAFGPDGFLYFSLGDGGGAHDGLADPGLPHGPDGNGQNPFTLLGSMLRIDVDGGSPFAIPVDNPFANGVSGAPEVYAYGFRNPYRFSFDDGFGGDNALYVGDVGQALFEEVDIVVNGGNYGWAIKEGFNCFDPFSPEVPPALCNDAGLIDPVMEYTHTEGGLSVIGGFVYRGSQFAGLVGKYVFGDFSDNFAPPGGGRLYFFDTTGPDMYERVAFSIIPGGTAFIGHFLKGMGEDEDGEIYAMASNVLAPTGTSGKVFRIVEPVCLTPADCGDDDVCTLDGCLGTACSHDPNIYGDVDGNGFHTLADVFCILDGFAGDFSTCTFAQDDIHGACGVGLPECCSNGTLGLGDIFAFLDAFAGIDPCCSP